MIDVCLITFNRLPYTKKCIESMFNNTKEEFRLFVYDDYSLDGTREYLESLEKLKLIKKLILSNENKGTVHGRNTLLNFCNSNYVYFSDNDAFFRMNWLEELKKILDNFPKIGIATGWDIREALEYNGIKIFSKKRINDVTIEMPGKAGTISWLIRKNILNRINFTSRPGWEESRMCFAASYFTNRMNKIGYFIGLTVPKVIEHMDERNSKHYLGNKWNDYNRWRERCKYQAIKTDFYSEKR